MQCSSSTARTRTARGAQPRWRRHTCRSRAGTARGRVGAVLLELVRHTGRHAGNEHDLLAARGVEVDLAEQADVKLGALRLRPALGDAVVERTRRRKGASSDDHVPRARRSLGAAQAAWRVPRVGIDETAVCRLGLQPRRQSTRERARVRNACYLLLGWAERCAARAEPYGHALAKRLASTRPARPRLDWRYARSVPILVRPLDSPQFWLRCSRCPVFVMTVRYYVRGATVLWRGGARDRRARRSVS